MNNEHHPCRGASGDKGGTLEKSTDATNIIVDEFIVSMKTTGGYNSWLIGNNERHNRSIRNIVISGLLGINQYKNK